MPWHAPETAGLHLACSWHACMPNCADRPATFQDDANPAHVFSQPGDTPQTGTICKSSAVSTSLHNRGARSAPLKNFLDRCGSTVGGACSCPCQGNRSGAAGMQPACKVGGIAWHGMHRHRAACMHAACRMPCHATACLLIRYKYPD